MGSFALPQEGVDETSGQAVLESKPEIASNPVWQLGNLSLVMEQDGRLMIIFRLLGP